MIERIKNWLIKKLGGYTWAEYDRDIAYYLRYAFRLRDKQILCARKATEWEKRAIKAEARVEAYEKLDQRLRRLVHLRTEIRESMEVPPMRQVTESELERWIKRRLAAQMADGILEHVGTLRTEDLPNHEYVWACECYLLRREDMKQYEQI